MTFDVENELEASFLALDDLIVNKIASGRLQGLADAEKLIRASDI